MFLVRAFARWWAGTTTARSLWPAHIRCGSRSLRFLVARGLYHALFACAESERLVTDAYTWDQQASRAFAAELLAPQAGLTARTGGRTDHSKVEELAKEFGASTMVIEKQLENAGVALVRRVVAARLR